MLVAIGMQVSFPFVYLDLLSPLLLVRTLRVQLLEDISLGTPLTRHAAIRMVLIQDIQGCT